MYYPHLERQDQYVRVLSRIKRMEDTLEEMVVELKAINDKMDELMKLLPHK